MVAPIQMIDLNAQRVRLGGRIEAAIARVVEHGDFIMGPEVTTFEAELAAYCGAQHVVTCANGTDALVLVMMAEAIGPGDAVFVPSFTFVATAEAVAVRGATPVFVDVDAETFNISVKSLESAVQIAIEAGLRPRGVIAVDLFGLPADYDRLHSVCTEYGLLLVADAAQSFGASYKNRHVGTLADYTTTSFFPSKPLGCYGDGGAVFVDDPSQADLLRSLRQHGKGEDKYHNVRVGLNSRLDTIQAAVLLEKLPVLDAEIGERTCLAEVYDQLLSDLVLTPTIPEHCKSAWAQYSVKLPNATAREQIIKGFADHDIPTSIYYPKANHLQYGYRHFPNSVHSPSTTSRLTETILSIPLHPYMTEKDVIKISKLFAQIVSKKNIIGSR